MEISWGYRAVIAERASGVDTTGAADKDLGIVLRVKIEQYIAGNHAVAEIVGTRKASFLIDGKKSLKGTVYKAVVDKRGKRAGHARYRCQLQEFVPFGTEPFAVDNCLDRGVVKVKTTCRLTRTPCPYEPA